MQNAADGRATLAAPSELLSPPDSTTTTLQGEGASGYTTRTRSSSDANFRPALRMTSSARVEGAHGDRSTAGARTAPPVQDFARHLAPPPLGPCVSPEHRCVSPPSSSTQEAIPSPVRHPTTLPPRRPPPSHIPRPSSHELRPPSPLASREKHFFNQVESNGKRKASSSSPETPPHDNMLGDLSRTASTSSYLSGQSPPKTMTRTVSAESSTANSGGRSVAAPEPNPGHSNRKKRTRVLMTHMQQNHLSELWKLNKFPTTQEREDLAADVGLTPRQVQVWFQNRRQTYRKQLLVSGMPKGSDPADYEDLERSPRSRRLSIGNTSDDRVPRWAESASSVSLQAAYSAQTHSGLGPSANIPEAAVRHHQPGRSTIASTSSYTRGLAVAELSKTEPSTPDDRARTEWYSYASPLIDVSPMERGYHAFASGPRSPSSAKVRPHTPPLRHTPRSPPPTVNSSSCSPRKLPRLPPIRRQLSMDILPQIGTFPLDISRPSELPPSLTAMTISRPVDRTKPLLDRRPNTFSVLEMSRLSPSIELLQHAAPSSEPAPRPREDARGIGITAELTKLPSFSSLFHRPP